MTIKNWKSLLETFSVTGTVTPVGPKALNEFERQSKLKLPASYRDYCRVFGAGILEEPDSYEISVPGAKVERFKLEANSKFYFHTGVTYPDGLLRNKDQLIRAWVFARDISRSKFFWDPSEVTVADKNEYAIYMIYENYDIERLADTFWDFVNSICLGSGPRGYSDYMPELAFEPSE